MTYPFFAGDIWDAGDANDTHGQVLYKAADTSFNSTTLANDPDLFATLEAGGVYDLRAFLLVNASNAGGFKCQQTGPAASSFPHVLWGTATGGTTFSSALDHGGTSTYTTDQRAGIGVPDGMYLEGTIINPTNAGTFNLLFGQAVASGTCVVMKGSKLFVRKMN